MARYRYGKAPQHQGVVIEEARIEQVSDKELIAQLRARIRELEALLNAQTPGPPNNR